MRRWLKITLLGLLLLPVLAGGLVAVVLGTETGAGWLLGAARDRVPGLDYARFEGKLYGGITFHQPAYAQDGLEVRAERLRVVAAPELFPFVVRLRTVEAEALSVTVPAEENDDTPPPESFELPLRILLDRLSVDGLRVSDAEGALLFEAERLSGQGDFFQQARFSQVELDLPQGTIRADGQLGLARPFPADVEADGALELQVEESPEPLNIDADVRLQGSMGAYTLNISGAARSGAFELDAEGVVALQEMQFEGRAAWRDFGWPLGGQPARFESRSGEVQLSGWLEGWRAEGQAEIEAPGVAAGTLTFLAEGDESQARIEVPEGRVLGGRIEGEGTVDWARGTGFQARLELDGVDTAPLYPDVPAVLSGGLRVEGVIEPLALDLDARELRAVMGPRTVTANGRAAFRPGELWFERFALRSAGSLVELDGSLDRAEGIGFMADIDDLGEFFEGASGRVSGNGRYSVTDGAKKLVLDLEAAGLGWGELRAQQARIAVEPPKGAGQWGVLNAEFSDASSGTVNLDRVAMRAAIDPQAQSVEMSLVSGAYTLFANLPGSIADMDGNWRNWQWQGQLETLRLHGPEGVLLEQQETAALALSIEEVELQSACFAVAGRARVCAEGAWSSRAGLVASAALDSVPLALVGAVATNLDLTQAVDGEAELRMAPGQGAEIDANFTLSPGEIRFVEDPRPLVETGEGRIGLKVVDGAIRSGTFDLPITGQGRIDFDYRVDTLEAGMQAPVSGRLVADFEDLDVLAVFLPIADELHGRLDADLLLSGTLEQPFLRGRLDLADGLIRHSASGLKLSDIQVTGQVDGRSAISLSGQFRAAEGSGYLEGLADISDLLAPSVQLDLSGDGLKLFDTPDLQLVVEPDIRLAWYEKALHVDGQLMIPSALVAPSVLPATPVLESPDVRVVAGELPEARSADRRRQSVKVFGSLDIVLGEDVDIDLSVSEADLTGQARFEWNGPVLPVANGEFDISGLILAYGQRLEITQGRISFPGVPADNPHLNVRAEREIYGNSEVRRAGLWVTGTLQRPQIEPYTDPMTTRDRARTLLVTGSDFNMERGSGAVSVGTYIAPRIFISYGVGVFDDERVISVRYDLGRGWGVMATSGERQTGVDMSYTIER